MLEALQKIEEGNEAEERIRLAYRQVFSGGNGEIVLEDMLFNLYFLQPCQTPEQQALSNYAKELLALVYGVPMESSRLRNLIRKLVKRRTK